MTILLRPWSSTLKLLLHHSHKPTFTLPSNTALYKRFLSSSSFSTATIPKRIGTHSGSFHCDEALGCSLLRLTSKFSGSDIVRTREPTLVLETLDAVLDVGGVYEPSRDRYDHHQKGFNEVFGHGFDTKLSSAGLVYKVFDEMSH